MQSLARSDNRPQQRRLLGIRVDAATSEDAFSLAAEAIRTRAPSLVITINTEMLMAARADPVLRDAIEGAALVVPDAAGLLAAGRLLRQPLPERVTGSDLMPALCRLAATRGWRPFFLGAAPGIAERVSERLISDCPGLVVAGTYCGSPSLTDAVAVLETVRSASPDLLFVAYGVPAEEKWLAANLAALGAPLAMGVGGAFNFVAGVLPRAPLWMRRAGLEWLHRLYLQPWRWRRMLALPRFAALVLAEAMTARLRWRRTPQGSSTPRATGERD